MSKRTMAGLILVGILVWTTASVAHKEEQDPPTTPAREIGPFVRAGRMILNVRQIDYIEARPLEGGGSILWIYLIGRKDSVGQVRGNEAAELFRVMKLPPIVDQPGKP